MSDCQRLTLSLDPTVVLEGLVLKRLEALSGRRRQDWLRSLLGYGYLAECRWLRRELPSPQVVIKNRSSSYAKWLTEVPAQSFDHTHTYGKSTPQARVPPTVASGGGSKVFSHLRAVVG